MDRRSFIALTAAVATPVPASAAWTPTTFKIHWRENGVDGRREVTGVVRGCWGIHRDTNQRDCPGITLSHLPSGYRAGYSEDEGVMEKFADALDRMNAWEAETPQSVKDKNLTDPVRRCLEKAGLKSLGWSEWALA